MNDLHQKIFAYNKLVFFFISEFLSFVIINCLIEMDNEKGLQTNAYQKKIHIGQNMHYASNQPEHVKVGTIKILAI